MALGSFLYKCIVSQSSLNLRKCLKSLYTIIFGVVDFHSHIRWCSVKKALLPCSRNVEIGAGWGLMSFQFILIYKKPITVLTYTVDEYKKALSIINCVGFLKNYVTLGRADAQNISFLPDNKFDQALLIDVLEHVPNDDLAVKEVYRILKFGGRVVVSVPTPYYPYYFTYEFDQKMGHLRHYTPKKIRFLFEKNGFNLILMFSHTQSLTGVLSRIWYGVLKNSNTLKVIIMPILLMLSFLTEKIHSPYYCGLIAIFKKPNI